MIRNILSPRCLLITTLLFFASLFTQVQAAAPSNISGWTFFVQITEGRFGFGSSGEYLLCLADSGSEFRMVYLDGSPDATGTYSYQASGDNGTVTIGDLTITFNFLDSRRGNYALIRGNDIINGYQLGKFSAGSGTYPQSLTNTVFDVNGRYGNTPVTYRMMTLASEEYFVVRDNNTATPIQSYQTLSPLNKSTARLFFNDGVLGMGVQHLIFISPTNGLFAFKLGDGKHYQKGAFAIQPASPPQIIDQPADVIAPDGGRGVLSIKVSGTEPMSYQWYKDNVRIPGATNAQLVLEPVSQADDGMYHVLVRNLLDSVVSEPAEFRTACPVKFNVDTIWMDPEGGTGEITVTSDCQWYVFDYPNWFIVNSGSGTHGNGKLTFTVLPNTSGSPRVESVVIGGSVLKVVQQGAYAPDNLFGKRLRLDSTFEVEGSPTNETVFLSMETRNSTNFFFSTLDEVSTNQVPYTYVKTSGTTAELNYEETTKTILTFSNYFSGDFFTTNSGDGTTKTGTFILSQRRGDITFDGRPDLYWQNLANQRQRVTLTWGGTVTNLVTTNAMDRLLGLSDISRDGAMDFVYFPVDRYLYAVTPQTNLLLRGGATVSTLWRVVSAEDVNGDGYPDILFQNIDGRLTYWTLGPNPPYYSGAFQLRNGHALAPKWLAVAVADINLDSQPDVIFWNTLTSQTAAWLLQQGEFREAVSIAGGDTPGTDWRLRAVADMNDDGHNDLLWQNLQTGAVQIWHMNKFNKVGTANLDFPDPNPNWVLIGPK